MPEKPRSTQGLVGSADVDRKGPKRADEDDNADRHDADKFTAAWFDAALEMWGKATAYAEQIGVDLNHVRRMRSGEKPTPLRALLPFFGNVEAVLAFTGSLLASIGYVAVPKRGPTRAEVLELLFAKLFDSVLVREFIYREGDRRGWSRESIDAVLRGEHHPESPND